jgi:pimeloyl-ACP methyl ester carboxylesterase
MLPLSMVYPAKKPRIHAKLHVETYGPHQELSGKQAGQSAITVVLCHGFGGSARNFRPQARALAASVRFVLFDMRGHARSEKPCQSDAYQFACLVDDLASVVEDHASGRVIVGGVSLGAAVALGYALQAPDRIAGLMLAAYPAVTNELATWAQDFAENIENLGLEAAGEQFVWGPSSRFDPRSRELIKQGFLEHEPRALAAMLRHSLMPLGAVEDMSDRLGRLRVPTRIVVGGDDAGSVAPCRLLSRLIPRATLSVIEGAGHVVNLARVSEFNEELRMLIAEVTK